MQAPSWPSARALLSIPPSALGVFRVLGLWGLQGCSDFRVLGFRVLGFAGFRFLVRRVLGFEGALRGFVKSTCVSAIRLLLLGGLRGLSNYGITKDKLSCVTI